MMHGHLNLPGAGFDFDDDIDDYESDRYEQGSAVRRR